MGCIHHHSRVVVDFGSESHVDRQEMIKEHHNIAIARRDTGSYEYGDNYSSILEHDEKYKTCEVERDIASKTESQTFTLNMVTLRVTNEISMLLHRNFKEYITCSNSNYLQRNNVRLGSWWYSAIKNLKYTGIIMQNNTKISTKYKDDLSPKHKIENKIELISGVFYTKIDFNDETLQSTFNQNDFANYLNNNILTKNAYFNNESSHYNESGYDHMILYKNINQIKSIKCFTNKQFEYMDNLDIKEYVDNKMPDELQIYQHQQEHAFIYISDLCTDVLYRQKGIATQIWLKLFNLYDKGTRFAFHVRFDNEEAHDLYFKLGFKHVGITHDYYAKDVHAWKMVLIL